ncbi:MAG: hypothetical protein HY369_04915 [Candidatus Aenigmarchaeota archaeon]|nr:hypothetical protein [Candidatus Aenigmarchaeota archaeon]
MDGESLTLVNRDYTIHAIRPCTMEKGKKMAKLRLTSPPPDLIGRLAAAGAFDEIKPFPAMGMATARLGGKHILIFSSGEVTIRAADDEDDVLKTAKLILALIRTSGKT